MNSEPTLVINLVESILAVVASFGVQVTTNQHDAIIVIAGAVFAVGNMVFAFWNRSKVSPTSKPTNVLPPSTGP